MDIADAVADLRAEAESLMTDMCVVTRNGSPGGSPTLDPVTGLYPDVTEVTVYVGRCSTRVPGSATARRPRESAGDEVTTVKSVFGVPASAARLLVADRVLFTASTFNPNLPGMRFTVTDLLPGSHQVAQKVSIEAVVG